MSAKRSKKASGKEIKAWLKYKPEYATSKDGAVVLPKPYNTEREKNGHYQRLLAHIYRRIQEGKLWQARIFLHPGNVLLFSWTERDGETHGGGALKCIEAQIQHIQEIDEINHILNSV